MEPRTGLIPREEEARRSQLPSNCDPQGGTGRRCGSGWGGEEVGGGEGLIGQEHLCHGDKNEGQGG